MSKTRIYFTVDIYNKCFCDPDTGDQLNNIKLPQFEYNTESILCIQGVTVDSTTKTVTNTAFDATDSFKCVGKYSLTPTDSALWYSDESSEVNVPGDWLADGTADPTQGQLSFRVNTDTVAFQALAFSDLKMPSHVWMAIFTRGAGDLYDKSILNSKFIAVCKIDTDSGAPSSGDPEYYKASECNTIFVNRTTLGLVSEIGLTISSTGAITKSNSTHTLSPYLGSTDTLETIGGLSSTPSIFFLRLASSTDTITFKNGTGNILTDDGIDFDLTGNGYIQCYSDGTYVYLIRTGIANKQDLIVSSTAGHLAAIDSNGQTYDSGVSAASVVGSMIYQRAFGSTSGDVPASGVTKGWYYICEENDYVSANAGYTFNLKDWAVYNGSDWDKIDASESGKVLASVTDVTPDYLDGKVAKSVVVNSNKLELSGDETTPDDGKVYGKRSGTKGWIALNGTEISNTPSGNITSTTSQDAINENDSNLTNHKNNTSNPHSVTAAQASAIALSAIQTSTSAPSSDSEVPSTKMMQTYVSGYVSTSAVTSVFQKTGAVANISDSSGYLYNDGAGNFAWGNPAGAGDVTGPSSSTDDNIALFNGGTGKIIKDSNVSISTVSSHIASTANPHAVTAAQAGAIATPSTPSQGDVLYYGGSSWDKLSPGTSGEFLKTQGAGANPVWGTPPGEGDVTGPAGATSGNIASYGDSTGKVIADSGISTSSISSHLASTANPHSVTAAQANAVATSGDETVAGIKTFSSFPITPSSTPTLDYQVANKKYVDDNAGASSFADITGSPRDNTELAKYTPDTAADSAVAGDNRKPLIISVGASFGDSALDAILTNLTHYYKFESNSNDSVGAINGSDTSVTYSAGKHNNAAVFNGSSSVISLGSESFGAGAFSVSFWFDANTVSGTHAICQLMLNSYGFVVYNSGSSLYFGHRGQNNKYASAVTLSADTAYFVVITYNGSGIATDGNFAYYLNSVSQTVTSSGTIGGSGSASYIGASNSGESLFSGWIDEFSVWDKALTQAEVTALYNSSNGRFYDTSNKYTIGSASADFVSVDASGFTGNLSVADTDVQKALDTVDGLTLGMTNPMNASGDIIYGGTSGTPTRLGKGSDGQVLKLASGLPSWADSASFDINGLTAITSPAQDDYVPVYSSANSANRKITLGNQRQSIYNTQTDSYVLVLTDAGKTIRINKSTASTVTIPLNSSVAYPIGTNMIIKQVGVGTTVISSTSSVTLNGVDTGSAIISAQYKAAVIEKVGTDAWEIIGSLT